MAVAGLLHPDHCFPHIQTQELEAVVPLIQLKYLLAACIVENNKYILCATLRTPCDDNLHDGTHGTVQFQQMWRVQH